jgi:hypothetical protein
MTPKFSLVVGIAAAALMLAAPAFAVVPTLDGGDSGYGPSTGSTVIFDNYKADAVPRDFWNYDTSGNRVANTSPGVAPQDLVRQLGGTTGTVSGHSLRFDNYRADPTPASRPTVGATDSGRDWPELGIGFALGIVALLGVLLVMRHARIRPLAH